MVEFPVFLRFGIDEKGKKYVDCSLKEKFEPLTKGPSSPDKKILRTVRTALVISIPDACFMPLQSVARIEIPVECIVPSVPIAEHPSVTSVKPTEKREGS
ncbi:MAG: hypothetical protein WC683_05180 [bacterium]